MKINESFTKTLKIKLLCNNESTKFLPDILINWETAHNVVYTGILISFPFQNEITFSILDCRALRVPGG
jgi:hypothetical protein